MIEEPRDESPQDADADAPEESPQAGAAGEPEEASPAEPAEPSPAEPAEAPAAENEPAPEAGPPAGSNASDTGLTPAPDAEEPAAEEPAAAPDAAAGEPAAAPDAEQPTATPDAAAEEPAADAVGPEIEGAEELDRAEAASADEPAAAPDAGAGEPGAEEPAAPGEPPRDRRPKREKGGKEDGGDEVIPGMHLEPDLVLEEQPREDSEFGQYATEEGSDAEAPEEPSGDGAAEPEIVATPLDLAADARYRATGKRKSAVARVILKPGEGTCSVNGRHLDEYFPRVKLQRLARQPLEATGNQSRMDVVARIHGGGVSAQANALRHGIARALVEADPALRAELKRRGYLTRDPRVKERKKAGLKKARKRPQFSKR